MKKIGEKYLPVGTVVMLKGGTKRVMIIGFCAVEGEKKDTMYDYSGCIYPEGMISSTQICLFNHDQIKEVYHMGLAEDEEEKEFKSTLVKLTTEQKNKADNDKNSTK